jgi:hypothetical protein
MFVRVCCPSYCISIMDVVRTHARTVTFTDTFASLFIYLFFCSLVRNDYVTDLPPNMVLAPLDSRNFAEQGTYRLTHVMFEFVSPCVLDCCFEFCSYFVRFACIYVSFSFFSAYLFSFLFFFPSAFLRAADYIVRTNLRGGKSGGWRERCVGVETVLKVHMYVYTIQSLPLVGRVDLAAVFLDSKKFQSENLLFSKFIL